VKTLDLGKIVRKPLGELRQHPENANNGDLRAIRESVERNGYYQPIIVQKSTGYIVSGNHRYQVAVELDAVWIPAIILDLTDEEAKRIMVADNRTARLGQDDPAQMLNLLEQLAETDMGLIGTGYSMENLQELIDVVHDDGRIFEGETVTFEVGTGDKLNFSIMPVPNDDGTCTEFTLSRPDFRPLTGNDLNGIRKAFGLAPLALSQLLSYGIEDWE
jgi:hypothetical protein